MKKYWVVYNPQTTTFQSYATRLEAEDAAKALAAANPESEFVIFEAVAVVKQPKDDTGITDKELIDQLEKDIKRLQDDLKFAEQVRDKAIEKVGKLEEVLDAIKQVVV